MTNRPSLPVVTVRSRPVRSSVNVMLTPGRTALPASRTVPLISERPPCPRAGAARKRTPATERKIRRQPRSITPPYVRSADEDIRRVDDECYEGRRDDG